jgi:hypothetical protein
VLPVDPTQCYPMCTGGKLSAPPEDSDGPWAYLAELDAHRYPPPDALRVLADAAQAVLETPAGVSIREALGDLEAIREAMDRLERYQQVQPSAWNRRHINAQLRMRTWTGDKQS